MHRHQDSVRATSGSDVREGGEDGSIRASAPRGAVRLRDNKQSPTGGRFRQACTRSLRSAWDAAQARPASSRPARPSASLNISIVPGTTNSRERGLDTSSSRLIRSGTCTRSLNDSVSVSGADVPRRRRSYHRAADRQCAACDPGAPTRSWLAQVADRRRGMAHCMHALGVGNTHAEGGPHASAGVSSDDGRRTTRRRCGEEACTQDNRDASDGRNRAHRCP
jgi:hypothetical protein